MFRSNYQRHHVRQAPGCVSIPLALAVAMAMHLVFTTIAYAQQDPPTLNRWTTNGPDGGSVLALAIDRSNPAIMYAGMENGVFKSTDGGENWSSSLTNASAQIVAIAPSTPATIYAAGTNGVYKSIDGGTSWNAMNQGLENQYGPIHILALTIDPTNPNIVYAAGPDITDPSVTYKAIYETIDGGASWSITKYSIRSFAVHHALAIDPTNTNTIYAGGSVGWGTVWKSTDGGYFWTIVNLGPDSRSTVLALTIDPTNRNVLYAGTAGQGVFRSTDGGATWSEFNDGLPFYSTDENGKRYFYAVSSVVIDPVDPTVIYAGTSGVFKSAKGGSWTPLTGSLTNGSLTSLYVNALAINSNNPNIIYAGTYNGIIKTINSGASWNAYNRGLRGAHVNSLAVNPGNANVYAGTYDSTTFKSINNGGSWSPTNFYPLAFDPYNSDTIYARRDGQEGLFKSTNAGASWSRVSAGAPNTYASFVLIDPNNSNVIYAGTDAFYKSTDGGENWSAVDFFPYFLVIDPRNSQTLYATYSADGDTFTVYKSLDGGATWNPSGSKDGPIFYWVSTLTIDPKNTATLYAVACAAGTDPCGIYKSTDSGENWTRAAAQAPNDDISSLVVDPTQPNVIYVGTYGNGVFKSSDGAASLNPFNDGLTDLNINALAIDAAGNFLHAGTLAGAFDIQLSATATPTPTPTPTTSPTPTPTPTPTVTPTATPTPTPTPTATPTATPTPTSAGIWSAPVNLGSAINSTSSDQGPAISPDGLSLYFTSNRTGGLGGFDMYVSQRASIDGPWGSPVNLGSALNTTSDEGNPAFSRDGRFLFFQSKRPGGLGGIDIWVAQRNNTHDDFNWQPAVNLGPGVNSADDDNGPTHFDEDDARGARQLYFGSTRTGLGGADIYVSNKMADGSFGAATLVTELSSPLNENRPSIRLDGLEIFFQSNRTGSNGTAGDLWVATRSNTLAAWSTPVNLGDTINTASVEQNPYLSSDGKMLFFSSDRPGGQGGLDLYVSTRTSVPGPSWTITGNLNTGRQFHTATLLPNGKVLVAGGNDSNRSFKSAELYDPATGTWNRTANLNADRDGHTATLLQNSKVLVAGGFSCGPPPQSCFALNGAELYDPATGTWSNTGNLNTARDGHMATLLQNGKVLIIGGDVNRNTAELYDPATGTWSLTGSLSLGLHAYTATLLPNGKVLVAGGFDDTQNNVFNNAELYDPATQTWSNTGSLITARAEHTAVLLPNGKVLVAGGFIDGAGQVTDNAELYDPNTGTWNRTGNLTQRRALHTATLLTGGKVLVAGGFFIDGLPDITNRAELYDPATGTWSQTASLNMHRRFHTATLLLNGRVLAAGGNGFSAANSAELYDTGTNQIDDAQFFVRQHYLDFLNRQPDDGGLAYWTNEITKCGSDARCIHERRIGVSAAFFIELEFQDTGYYVYRFYKASFGRQPTFAEFTSDRSRVIGGSSLEANKQAFADEWVQRDAFQQAYPITMSNTEFVNKLFQMAGLTASRFDAQRQQEIAAMNAGRSRALVLRDVIEIPDFKNIPDPNDPRYSEIKQISQYNPAFVLMQYFGYLRRDVDQSGYDFWLDIVNNREPNNYHGMVCAFITSSEYQLRFGSVVTRSNADCGQ